MFLVHETNAYSFANSLTLPLGCLLRMENGSNVSELWNWKNWGGGVGDRQILNTKNSARLCTIYIHTQAHLYVRHPSSDTSQDDALSIYGPERDLALVHRQSIFNCMCQPTRDLTYAVVCASIVWNRMKLFFQSGRSINDVCPVYEVGEYIGHRMGRCFMVIPHRVPR